MMKIIRPDATERFAEIESLILLIRDAQAPEIRKQHLDRLQRITDMLSTSLEDHEG
jgi:hypothetical protein